MRITKISSSKGRVLPILVMCGFGFGGCGRSIDNPTAPDTSVLEEIYESPPGTLSGAGLTDTAKEYVRNVQVLSETDEFGFATDLFDEVSDEDRGFFENSDELDKTSRPKRLLTVSVTYVCRGPVGDKEIDADRFGTATMKLKASEHGLYPVAWGHFDHCSEHAGKSAFTIDGDYYIALRASPAGGYDKLLSFDGSVETKSVRYQGALDFRQLADGTTEVRVGTDDTDDVIVGLDSDGVQVARDSVGEWKCELTKPRCENEETDQVLAP